MEKFVSVSNVIDWFRAYGHLDQDIPFETLVTDLRDSVPAADVAQVAHGKWVELEPQIALYACSCCNHNFLLRMNSNYCPNCGAKMDGGADGGAG